MSDWAEVLKAQARYRVYAEREVAEAWWAGLLTGAGIGALGMAVLTWFWS